MNRYYVEMEHPRGKEDYGTFYIYMMAYDSQQIIDMIDELKSFNMQVDVYDNWASHDEVAHVYGIELISDLVEGSYDAIVIAVDHSDYKSWGESRIRKLGKQKHILYDLKYVLPLHHSDMRL